MSPDSAKKAASKKNQVTTAASHQLSKLLRHNLAAVRDYVDAEAYVHAVYVLKAIRQPVNADSMFLIAGLIDREHSGAPGTKRRFAAKGVQSVLMVDDAATGKPVEVLQPTAATDQLTAWLTEFGLSTSTPSASSSTSSSASTSPSAEDFLRIPFFVRAAQGHSSSEVVDSEGRVIEIETMSQVNSTTLQQWHVEGTTLVHGTYIEHLPSIWSTGGLLCGQRTKVHTALVERGSPIVSGMRHNCNVKITIDPLHPSISERGGVWISTNKVVGLPGAPPPSFSAVSVLCVDGSWATWTPGGGVRSGEEEKEKTGVSEGGGSSGGHVENELEGSVGAASSSSSSSSSHLDLVDWLAQLNPPPVSGSKGSVTGAARR